MFDACVEAVRAALGRLREAVLEKVWEAQGRGSRREKLRHERDGIRLGLHVAKGLVGLHKPRWTCPLCAHPVVLTELFCPWDGSRRPPGKAAAAEGGR